jgi:polar amino acid transport system substrate-binding protein
MIGIVYGQEKVVVATDATLAPMESLNSSKDFVGIEIDLMNEISRAAHFEVEFRNVAWDQLFTSLQAGKCDAVISSVTILDWRKVTVDFSEPYLSMPQVVVVGKMSTGIASIEDLYGKKIGALKGSRTLKLLQNESSSSKWSVIEYVSSDELFYAIEYGKVNAVFVDKILAEIWLKNPADSGIVKIACPANVTEDFGIAVRKGNSQLLGKINAGIKATRDSGTLYKIIKPLLY